MKLETCGRASCLQINAAFRAASDEILNIIADERDSAKAAAKHWHDRYRSAVLEHQDHVARLGAEIVALRLDAERYRMTLKFPKPSH